MGIHLAVKKSTPAACGSYASLSAAIAAPFVILNSFIETASVKCDAGEYVAVQYNDSGGSEGFLVNFELENISDNAAAMNVYSVNDVGTIIGTVNHPDGVIGFGDESIEIPSGSIPFYIVIQNVGGDSCDNFDLHLFQAS